jgi:tetratricopeptide (TPR) repeat protein
MLAGDVEQELGDNEEALGYYMGIVEDAEDAEISETAVLRAADMFYSLKQWEKAAEYYDRILEKGITWETRQKVSLPLARCYTELGRCRDALDIYEQLLEKVKQRREKAPIILGQARGYECMDSLRRAIEHYEDLIGKFPKSSFSAEASYYLGNLYHQKTDSLHKAKEYFGKVSEEDPESEFASESLKKANSISRLIEFEAVEEGEETPEQRASRNFYKAEIQLVQFNQFEKALENYRAIVDSFPRTEAGRKSAYAIGWIYEHKLDQPGKAVSAYTRVARDYPRHAQASGALDRIEFIRGEKEAEELRSYVDSVRAVPDTTGDAAAGTAVSEADSVKVFTTEVDSDTVSERDSLKAAADSTAAGGR